MSAWCNMVRWAICVALMLVGPSSSAKDSVDDPFRILRQAYRTGDADLAASAYGTAARYEERYEGAEPVVRIGRAEIRAGFAALFSELGLRSDRGADLNFRMAPDQRSGFYRLSVPGMAPGYGRFDVSIEDGRFTSDISGSATLDDFENAPGRLRFADEDEELDPAYYDRAVGRYLRKPDDPCGLIITRSVRRYFLLDECSGAWRGLNRKAGRSWTAGTAVIDPNGEQPVEFNIASRSLRWRESRYGLSDTVRRTEVSFASDVSLAGTLYRPTGPGPTLPAVVLVHGSGPQDRNGYASLMALYAEHLARHGFIVLSYDKRGVGKSGGDWNAAGFDELARDAAVGLAFLRAQPGVDHRRVGLMGSSQAGWVVAEAIGDGAKPDFTLLVGAAGAALTVAEQNVYNTEVRMRCAGLSEADIAAAIAQQRAFFAAKLDRAKAPQLLAATAAAQARPAIADWLFPATVERTAQPQWYDVLDPAFDPLPIWRAYRGSAHFIFGALDDSTPTAIALERLRNVRSATIVQLRGAQHVGLDAEDICKGELSHVAQFNAGFFGALDRALRAVGSPRERNRW